MKILTCILLVVATCSISFAQGKPLKIPATSNPKRVGVLVEGLNYRANEFGLTKSFIQSKVEKTLIGFNLEPSDDEPSIKGYLYINVLLGSSACKVSVEYHRKLWDPEQLEWIYGCQVWGKGMLLSNADRDRIAQILIELTEEFCTEYIKQNRKPAY